MRWGQIAKETDSRPHCPDSTGSAEGNMPVEFFSSLEAIPDEEGNLFEVHLDASACGFSNKNSIFVIDLDG